MKQPDCSPDDHVPNGRQPSHAEREMERAAQLFRAMGDTPRLRMLDLLSQGEMCVTEIVTALSEKFSTISQRLRVLRSEGLVRRRRDGTHLYYRLADRHVVDLIQNALAHAHELGAKEGD